MKISYLKRSLLCFLLIFALTVPLFGCDTTPKETNEKSSNTPTDEATIPYNDYSYIEKDGKMYISFDDLSRYSNSTSGYLGISFDSVQEMSDSVLSKKLTAFDKQQLAMLAKNETIMLDENTIEICDFDNLYTIGNTPKDFKMTGVYWYANGYTLFFVCDRADCNHYDEKDGVYRTSPSVFFGTESYLNQNFQNEEEIKGYDLSQTKKENIGESEVDVEYYEDANGNTKYVKYTLQKGNKTFVVYEHNDIIEALCKEGDISYGLRIVGNCHQQEMRSDWFMDFSVEKFVPEK